MGHTIGVVGAGVISETMHLPVLTRMPGVRVVWVADADDARAEALARAYRVSAAPLPGDPGDLPACDAVLLAAPPGVRPRYYQAFAARGTAVLAEKPFATSAQAHEAAVRLFPPHGIACGFQRRTYASTRLVRRLLRDGWLGAPRRISIREGDRLKQTGANRSHLEDRDLAGGGVLISLGCHSLDWAVWVTGAESYDILSSDLVYDGALDRKVSARIRLRAPLGEAELDYVVSWIDPQPNAIELDFGTVVLRCGIEPGAELEIRGREASRAEAVLEARSGGAVTSNQAFYLEWRAFLDGLDAGAPSEVAAASALLTTRLIEDLYRNGGTTT